MHRRNFLAMTASAAGGTHISGADNRLRLGIIGAGSRGSLLMRYVNEVGGAEWAAVADVYGAHRFRAEKIAGKPIEKCGDYRRLLENKDVEAVIIATPDHWHARMIIDAVRAGKDVFCEKPMTVSPMQGQAVVKAVRETNRIVQIGTQQRSLPVILAAKQKFFESGLLGTVTMVHCHWNRNGGYLLPPIPPELEHKPEDLDWNAWLGPLPKVPWDPKRFLRPFMFWGPSTGPTGNLLIHFLDVIHWCLGLRKPSTAMAMGGLFYFRDGRDVPDTFSTTLQYPEGVLVSYDCCVPDQVPREGLGMVFMGSGGRLHVFRGGYRFLPSEANAKMGELTAKGQDGPQHIKNWLDCVRSRQQPNSDVMEGHYLATACHLANIAYFRNQRAYWQEAWDIEEV
jgi:predicted dehydrogenase